MDNIDIETDTGCDLLEDLPDEVSEADERNFLGLISTELTPKQREEIVIPPVVFPEQQNVLAVHWHPEHVPLDLIARRIDATFPNKTDELIIPTQHNVLMRYNEWFGVEVDCYSTGFNQKVQLLLHFHHSKEEKAGVLKSMLTYTFKYRSQQLFDYIETIVKPHRDRLEQAARITGTDEKVIDLVINYVKHLVQLLERHRAAVSPEMLKNKLLRDFFDTLRPQYGHGTINRAQAFLRAVKEIVKADFPLQYFFRTSEIIEEARCLGCGILVPHPEQFWPILLAEYDLDGYEVWNPQSRKYTEFLISVVDRSNRRQGPSRRKMLLFMGDDTHLGEKLKDPSAQYPDKACREIGVHPAWDDLSIRKKMISAAMDRRQVIIEYRDRLLG
ncbi:MAG: hypothetical protein HQK57_08685 [Deltaproteobacteria bacterium]|nr:hypothetical protein [Deltaproteobacteria bacterium]MBF0523489.1 hypothetical protein [Deltaproteobacteria bacterium]